MFGAINEAQATKEQPRYVHRAPMGTGMDSRPAALMGAGRRRSLGECEKCRTGLPGAAAPLAPARATKASPHHA